MRSCRKREEKMNRKNYGLMVVLALLVACAPGPDDWREVITIQTTGSPFRVGKLGILPFSCNNPVVGDMVADSVAANLLDSPFAVIERAYLVALLQEQALSITGFTETSDYRKIGNLANVDFLLVGTVGLLEGVSYRWGKASKYSFVTDASARIVSVETGQILVSCSYQIPSGGGSKYWMQPTVVGKTIALALKEALEKKRKSKIKGTI
jgi:hypothetical protein